MRALTPEEAEELFGMAVDALETLDDDSRRPDQSVPRSVLNKGEAMVLLGALVATIAESYPHVSASVNVLDLAASYYREAH